MKELENVRLWIPDVQFKGRWLSPPLTVTHSLTHDLKVSDLVVIVSASFG